MSASHLRNVLIVGAAGQFGSHIVQQLLEQGKHNVSALTRPQSSASMPSGLHSVRKADYHHPDDELAAAMKGQDILVIIMGYMAEASTSIALIDAAAAAGIKYIIPNEWGTDRAQVQLGKDLMLAEGQIKICKYIESKGLKWISIGCGFWYDYSLANNRERFGFDFAEKRVTIFDDGNTKITVSTWAQIGLCLARVLALPFETSSGPSISKYENSQVLVSSFHVSQRDMFESVLRVTGDQQSDWTITSEAAEDRFARGMELLQKGDLAGFTLAMYSRAVFADDAMYHESKVANAVLGLPKEDFDEATRAAVSMARNKLQC
ncbi:hypothetical protein QM012_002174 [Aureobasidium pullulans]|uniref:NmrA-like domain-containing protein n=1 Tax=Aureobasidium pullulans TaxID=5580 RepID=A0ABR0TB62_AURPU